MDKNKIIRKIQQQIYEIDDIELELRNLELEIEEKYIDKTKIRDLNKFIRKLKEENLYTKELEEFIENYIKYDNGDD